ncbi:type ISP restriction/modification enzyme [Brachybacterium sp. AOP25-B2-12]|uniref:type ISP restriction/modification enzyme n=1 Tax=Brachybacterium sp. AOP25-B2-12 TaxID=3457710 RepID=UPI004034C0BD
MTYPILGGDTGGRPVVFGGYSAGLQTNRDAWVYNSSRSALDANLARFIGTYSEERARFAGWAEAQKLSAPKGADTVGVVSTDETRIKWTSGLRDRAAKNRDLKRSDANVSHSLYRPFMVQNVDLTDGLIHRPAVARRYFPTAKHENFGFYLTGIASHQEFSSIGTRLVPDLHALDTGQFFPRYRWEATDAGTLALELGTDVLDGYRRIDNITDGFHTLMRERYGADVTKDDVFSFIYGLLHSPEYRERYAGELKQMLPRIPDVSPAAFTAFTSAGRELFGLHADYEDAELYPLEVIGGEQPPLGDEEGYYRVEKIRFPSGKRAADTPDSVVLNPHLTVTGIPEAAYRYQLGSRSAIEWVMRQYQVSTDKASRIVNDPNFWGIEHGNPRYILDLVQKVVSVSVRTVEITDSLPSLAIGD